MVEQDSARFHVGSDVELNSIGEWLLVGSLASNGVDSPALVGSVVAVPPDDMTVVLVDSTVDVEALASLVSDVLSVATVELDELGIISSNELSDNSMLADVESLAGSVGQNP
jgi:hypothetical protein